MGRIENGRTVPDASLVDVGEMVSFVCDDGLRLQGAPVAVCEPTTRLNITEYPVCTNSKVKSMPPSPRRCPAEDMEILKKNLGVTRTSNDSTTEEAFHCPAGFRLEVGRVFFSASYLCLPIPRANTNVYIISYL